MGKAIKWIFILGILGGLGWVGYKWYATQSLSGEVLSLIPADAIYCLSTDDPINAWKEISESKTWQHLQHNSYFAALTASANSLDSLIRDNDLLFKLIGSRSLMASAHMTAAKQYDFLFLLDLKGASGIKFLKEYLTDFSAEGYTVRKEKYKSEDIIVLKGATAGDLYISMPGSYLIASFTKKIITSSLDAREGINALSSENFMSGVSEIRSNGILQIYVNYVMLPKFMHCYSDANNEYVNRIAQALKTTSLNFSLENEMMKASGSTTVNDSVESYIKTAAISGKAGSEFLEITPQRSAFVMGLGFTSFSLFFENFEKNLQQDVTEYKTYRDNLKQVENFLNISIQKNFIDWIGDEVALLELQSYGKGLDSETAVIFKADNIEKAKESLNHVEKMVRRRTPVKFKTVDHRGYDIKYLGMKGLFKILLGKFFARYDKPYYTVINNFVVFSNHPQTLESMIDDHLDKKTLNRSSEFRSFQKSFDDESAAFVYLNTPVLLSSIKKLTDAATRVSIDENKEYITCFRHVGFQLVPDKSGFKTFFAEQFIEPPTVVEEAKPDVLKSEIESVEDDNEVVIEEPEKKDSDPMELPYIYVKNLNAKSFTDYFADSTVHFEVELKSGFKDGDFTEYYENGEVKLTGKFKKDKREGVWRLHDESGKLILKRSYEAGEVTKEKSKD